MRFEDPYGKLIRKAAHELVEMLEQPSKRRVEAYSGLKMIVDFESAAMLAKEAELINALMFFRMELRKIDLGFDSDMPKKKRGRPKIITSELEKEIKYLKEVEGWSARKIGNYLQDARGKSIHFNTILNLTKGQNVSGKKSNGSTKKEG